MLRDQVLQCSLGSERFLSERLNFAACVFYVDTSAIAVASLLTITGAEPATRHRAHQRTHGATDIRLYPGWPPHAVGLVVLVAEPAMAMRSWPGSSCYIPRTERSATTPKWSDRFAVLMDVADDAEGVGGEVLAKRDVVDGSPPLKAQARGGDQQVRPEGGLEGSREGEVALHCVARSAG